MHDGVTMDGWVGTFDSDLNPLWVTRWPESTIGATAYASRCLGAAFDASNDIIAVGYQCNATCAGAVSKMAGSDGTQAWEKVFTDVQSFERITMSTDGSGDFFVRGKLFTTTGNPTAENPTPFGVACAADDCGVIARMSSDGAVIWARTIEGADWSMRYFSGEIELDATGAPYIYVAMKDAAQTGVVSLDSGTPYAGCKDANGVVTPAYAVDAAKMVTSADCPAGSTFVDTDSTDAVWAASANTGVHCVGNTDDNCIIKYHTFTGKPEWAVTTPYVNTVMPLADGTVHAIGYGSGQTFDTVSTPESTASWTWHAEYDGATGKGKLVHSFGSATGSGYTRTYDMGATTAGDLILTGYAGGTSTYHDEGFTLSYPEDDQENHLFVLKLDTSSAKVKPSCITSTSTCEIDANSCYINGLCFASGETAAVVGDSCQVCDPTKSQTAFSDGPTVGTTECYISGVCRAADDVFSYRPRYSPSQESLCQYCDPPKSGSGWSVKDGYTAVAGANPPDDCLAADVSTDSGDSTDTTTETGGGGTLSESDGAQALVAGVLAPLAALLL